MEKFDLELVKNFKIKSNFLDYPNCKNVKTRLERILLVLYIVKKELSIDNLQSYQIKSILVKVYGEPFTDMQISKMLAADEVNVKAYGGKGKTRASFEIMRDGEMLIEKHIERNKEVKSEPVKGIGLMTLVQNTRKYIEKPAEQVDGCYDKGWYDASAVMIRRVIETLIIECFEREKISSKIKDAHGNFYMLEKLIDIFLSESVWNVGRNTVRSLPKFKNVGDNAAHNRRWVTNKQDIDNVKDDLRICIQELLFISKNN